MATSSSDRGALAAGEIPRFHLLDVEELLKFNEGNDSNNTKKQINYGLSVFCDFCQEIKADLNDLNDEALDLLLSQFYAGARRQNGVLYSKKTMQALRFSLQRHFLDTRSVDITKDKLFSQSEKTFKTVVKNLKATGKAVVKHHPAIPKEDMTTILQSLDLSSADGLQKKVFIDTMLYFANRGMENLREMKPGDFILHEADGNNGTSQVHPIFHLRALCLSGQRSFWQSAIRLTIHQPTNETTDGGTNLGHADVGEREPEFYVPVPPERAEQQSLLLARPSCQPKDARISRVAIVGTPNSGKSTLINTLLGRRICAVSPKVHTTMSKALAVITHRNTQVVLLDTPGLVSYTQGRRHKLSRSLLVDAKNTFLESDLVAVLVDVSNKWTNLKLDPEILIQLHTHSHIPSILVLNKVDALQTKQSLFEITEALTEGMVDGKEFVSPRRKGKLRNQMKDSVNSQRTNEKHGEKNDAMKSDKMNAAAPTGDDIDVTTVGSVLSSSSKHRTTNNPCVRENAMKEMRRTQSSVKEEDQCGLHVQDYDRFSNASASSELSSANSKGNHTQSTGSHMTDHVTDDMSQVTEDNTVQSHDLDRTKRDIMQQYAANLLELSDDGDEAVARQHSEADDEEMREKEREEMERQREERRRLWKMAKERSGWPGFKAVYMVSALHGDGVNDLKDFLLTSAKPGDWEYHEDVVTNLTPDEIVRDAIREKLLETLPEEVPYNISQSTELWQTGEGGELHIVQILICHKKSHVRMLEKKLGWIGRQVTQDLMDAFHCDVRLSLYVRFKK